MNETLPPAPGGQPKTSGLAITSLVLGILAIVLTVVCVGPLLAVPAIICGHLACSRINRSGGELTGKGLAIAGFVTGYVSLAFLLLLLPIAIPNFIKARDTAMRNACINNLRQIDGAKQQWAFANGKDAAAVPTATEFDAVLRGIKTADLKCPKGGTYKINAAGVPTCSIPGHELSK